jgi:alkenylglycerophosphocholine hydrolase
MKKYGLPIFILIMSLLYIFIIPSEPVPVKLLFKIVPMILIIMYVLVQRDFKQSFSFWSFMIGLIFCTLGDGLIVYSFVYGLAAFLVGHLFYLAGFIRSVKFSILRLSMIVPIAFFSFVMSKELINALLQDGDQSLIVPVLAYVIIIACMALSAILTGNRFATIGSILFLLSDSILSWNLFVSDIPSSGIWIMSTYYAAQFLIAHSAGLISNTGKVEQSPKREILL